MTDLTYSVRLTADGGGLKGELRVTEAELRRLQGTTDRTARSTRDASRETATWGRRLGTLRGSLLSVRGALAGLGVGLVVRDITRAGLETEKWFNSLRAATGSAGKAAEELAFLRREADRLGLPIADLADGFTGFLAAARGTALEGEKAREVFTAVAEAARVMGKSGDETRGALLALQQMMSKGKVSSEELTGQLSERLPGAFNIFARALGVSTQQLGDMLQKGEVLADEALPKFAAELRKSVEPGVAAAVGSAAAEFARFDNAVQDLSAAVAESGLLSFLSGAARGAADLVREFTDAAVAAGYLQKEVARLDLATVDRQLTENYSQLMGISDPETVRTLQSRGILVQGQIDNLLAQRRRLVEQRRALLAEAANPITPPPGGGGGGGGGGGDGGGGGGGSSGRSAAEKEADDFARSLARLRDQIDPTGAAVRQYHANLAILDRALAQGVISQDEYGDGLKALAELLNDDLPWNTYSKNARDAFEKVKDEAAEAAEVLKREQEAWTAAFSANLADSLTGAEADWKGFLRNLTASLLESQIFSLLTGNPGGGSGIAGSLVKGLSGLVDGFFAPTGIQAFAGATGPEPFFHGGGVVGEPGGMMRAISPDVFAGARRMHTGGIAGDEVPAILRKGEEVLTRGDPRHRDNAGGGVTVVYNIDARGADVGVEARIRQAMDQARQATIAQIVREVNAGGPMARTFGRRR